MQASALGQNIIVQHLCTKVRSYKPQCHRYSYERQNYNYLLFVVAEHTEQSLEHPCTLGAVRAEGSVRVGIFSVALRTIQRLVVKCGIVGRFALFDCFITAAELLEFFGKPSRKHRKLFFRTVRHLSHQPCRKLIAVNIQFFNLLHRIFAEILEIELCVKRLFILYKSVIAG